ncbi:uncharacterized protein LOC122258959 isoform X4 [Penaeus japonicus]|uniref:uncharacterized protein LOC122258959 isoform X3 n=1 Tax=Penaeus japonicus TaxID=27405 RepID=UPI001C71429A|nr:uncharacterized protein LOC122258959 isoform X3 [Penaeus japonicus]XP_042881274.1 uncharacterized protein LOC122258959 isoform X4 [Penaeus japonicus]
MSYFKARWVRVPAVLIALSLFTAAATTMPLVPSLPKAVEDEGVSLVNIWNHALRNQKDESGSPLVRSEPGPKTILAPDPFRMMNLVPQDAAHPLYSNKYTDLRTEFLLDYMLEDAVSPDDPKMAEADGLTVTNLFGKSITFRKDAEGKLSVEGQSVEEKKQLPEGIMVYQLSGFLFDHRERVRVAFEALQKETPRYGPMGRPLNMPMPPMQPPQ